jgi:hypothetical protein
MADVIHLEGRKRTTRRVPSTGPAEIVLFPGVRYEYHHDREPPVDRRRRAASGDGRDLAEVSLPAS